MIVTTLFATKLPIVNIVTRRNRQKETAATACLGLYAFKNCACLQLDSCTVSLKIMSFESSFYFYVKDSDYLIMEKMCILCM